MIGLEFRADPKKRVDLYVLVPRLVFQRTSITPEFFRRSSDARRSRVCRKELRAGPRADIRIRQSPSVDADGATVTDPVALREGPERATMEGAGWRSGLTSSGSSLQEPSPQA